MTNILAVLLESGQPFGRTQAEILSAAKRLADDVSGQMTAVVIGADIAGWPEEAGRFGAKRVRVLTDPALGEYQLGIVARAVVAAIQASAADIILLSSTALELELTPAVAHRIDAAVVLDCIGIAGGTDSKRIQLTKPVYGGKAHSLLTIEQGPLVVSLRMRSVQPLEPDPASQAEQVTLDLPAEDPGHASAAVRVISREVEGTEGERLEDARIIIAGGRGLGGKESFAQLEDLARQLGGTVGASRAACDLGWVPASKQIGQTGKKVAPDLYLAVGISGASQHMVGLSGARHIVAVNNDPKAPIFGSSTFGIVEDWNKFIPAFYDAVKQHVKAQ